MQDLIDIWTIIFLALAVVIFLKMRRVFREHFRREGGPQVTNLIASFVSVLTMMALAVGLGVRPYIWLPLAILAYVLVRYIGWAITGRDRGIP